MIGYNKHYFNLNNKLNNNWNFKFNITNRLIKLKNEIFRSYFFSNLSFFYFFKIIIKENLFFYL
jgi:hypothetical protein